MSQIDVYLSYMTLDDGKSTYYATDPKYVNYRSWRELNDAWLASGDVDNGSNLVGEFVCTLYEWK